MSVVLVCLLVCLGSESLFDVLPWLRVVLVDVGGGGNGLGCVGS